MLPAFDDQQFAMDLLEHKHVLLAPGTSFNTAYNTHFRITNLPRPEVLTDVFRRMHARASTDLRTTLQATLTRLVENHLQMLGETLGKDRCEVLLQLRRYSARNLLSEDRIGPAMRAVLEACAEHQSPLLPVSSALPVWREIASMLFKKDRNKDELYESVNARHGFPTTNRKIKEHMLDLLRALSSDERLCGDLATLRSMASKYRLITARTDSGSRASPSFVDPCRSLNTIVTVRRSSRASTVAASGVPQNPHRRKRSGFDSPQFGQTTIARL